MRAATILEKLARIEREISNRPVIMPKEPAKPGDVIADIPEVLSDYGARMLGDLRLELEAEDVRERLQPEMLTEAEQRLIDQFGDWLEDYLTYDSNLSRDPHIREQLGDILKKARKL